VNGDAHARSVREAGRQDHCPRRVQHRILAVSVRVAALGQVIKRDDQRNEQTNQRVLACERAGRQSRRKREEDLAFVRDEESESFSRKPRRTGDDARGAERVEMSAGHPLDQGPPQQHC